MRFHLLYYPLGRDGECMCPPLPLQLLTVCRLVYNEVLETLYSQNKFRVFLDGEVRLSPRAVANMTSLHVRLNTCSCVSDHTCELPRGRCLTCHRKCKRGPDPPLSTNSDLDMEIVHRWGDFCKVLERTLRPEMRLSVICDSVNLEAAKQVVWPMQCFPKLTGCAIRLGQSPNTDLTHLAEDTVLRLTRRVVDGWKSFRFLDLPRELRSLILWHTDLVAPSILHWRQYYSTKPLLKINQWEARHHACCMRCTDAGEACCCAVRHAAFSSASCSCWRYPSALFLVSKEFYKEAMEIFFRSNTFMIWAESWNGDPGPEYLEPSDRPELTLFQRLPSQSLKHLRWVKSSFTGGESLVLWRKLTDFLSHSLDTSNLTVGLECTDPSGEDFGWDMEEEDALDVFQNFAAAFQFKHPLKDFFVYLPLPAQSGVPPELCAEWERTLERQVMGVQYDAEARGKYINRGYTLTDLLRRRGPV